MFILETQMGKPTLIWGFIYSGNYYNGEQYKDNLYVLLFVDSVCRSPWLRDNLSLHGRASNPFIL